MKRSGSMSTMRLRKCECAECAYVVRVSRAVMARGLPACGVCGTRMLPTDPGDMIELGIMSLDDLPRTVRTEVCRQNGWEDAIVRTSPSQQPGSRRARPIKVREAMPF